MSEEQNMGSEPAQPILLKGNEGACDLERLERLLATSSPGPWEPVDKPHPAEYMQNSRIQFVKSSRVIKNDRGPDYAHCVFDDGEYPEKAADHELAAWIKNNGAALISSAREAGRLRAALTSDSVTPTADLMEFVAARLVACTDKGTGDCDLTDYVQALRREAKKQRAALSTETEAATRKPGLDWKLSDEAARDIEAINRAIVKPGGFS